MNPSNQTPNSGSGNKPFVKKWFPRNNQKNTSATGTKPTGGFAGAANNPSHNTRTHVSRDNNFRKPFEQTRPATPIPPLAKGDIRIIPIGGVEEITKNMTLVEYNDQIVIIDAGIKMGDSGPGITTTIPDITYLEQRKHLIKAMVITHGHFDHVAAIPFVIEKLGNPPIYTREFGAMIIKKRQEEHPHLAPLNIHIVDKEAGSVTLSEDLKVRFFGLTHSIPDSTGVIIETPHGDIVSTGDVRVENIDGVPVESEVEQYKLFKDRNVLLMTMDSTGIPVPGWSLAESIVTKTIDKLIADAKGRILIAAFASQVERLIKFIESAKRYGRYVVVEGRSMKGNIAIVKQLGLTDLDHVIDVEEMYRYPVNKILILATGAQGEEYSLLDRVSRGTHKFIKLTEHDTLIFSASVVPGNERTVDELKDRIYRCNPKVITYADTQVHSSGHGKRDELAWIHTQINYKFFMPIHGSHYRLKMHRDLMLSLKPEKTKDDVIVPDDGTIVEIRERGTKLVRLEARAPHDRIVIDGTYIGPVQEAILRDRTILSEEGFIQVVVAINQRTGKLYKSPDIISRGFIYLRNNQELLHKVRVLAKKTAEDSYAEKGVNIEMIKDDLVDKIKRVLTQKTGKRPLIIAVVLIF
jgi:ribonuclease J